MTAAIILYAFCAFMLYVGIMGAISHNKPKPKHPHHTQEETHV